MDMKLNGKTALVGGGSRGLGFACARRLAAEGARVAIVARQEEGLRHAQERLGEQGVDVLTFQADLSRSDDVERLVEQALAQLGQVDILVGNTGGPPPGGFADFSEEDFEVALQANLLGQIRLCRRLVPAMVERRWGRVVFVSSLAARQPLEGLMLSTTARAGLLGFAKALSDEVAEAGVSVNTVMPGLFRTERVVSLAEFTAHRQGHNDATAVFTSWEQAVPARRLGEPDEFADLVSFLASPLASYITGAAIPIDGGRSRSIV